MERVTAAALRIVGLPCRPRKLCKFLLAQPPPPLEEFPVRAEAFDAEKVPAFRFPPTAHLCVTVGVGERCTLRMSRRECVTRPHPALTASVSCHESRTSRFPGHDLCTNPFQSALSCSIWYSSSWHLTSTLPCCCRRVLSRATLTRKIFLRRRDSVDGEAAPSVESTEGDDPAICVNSESFLEKRGRNGERDL